MPEITVKLNIAHDPPVTCDPHQCPLPSGEQTIAWSKGGSDKAFKIIRVVIDDSNINGPFTNNQPNGEKWNVHDKNNDSAEYFYELTVETLDKKTYSTKEKRRKIGGGGGGGGPSIKNN